MPAVSKRQRRAMAVAEHHPEMLYAKNKGMAEMSKRELHKFASTKEKGLPSKRKKNMSGMSMHTEVDCAQGSRHKTMSMDECMKHAKSMLKH